MVFHMFAPGRDLSTPEFCPRTLRDTARFILVVNNMSCAIFRSEKLELLLHTPVYLIHEIKRKLTIRRIG